VRVRHIATCAATLIAAASLSPMTAEAAGQNTVYVSGGSSACTDSGSGTYAVPFCTIQAAADAAVPGDVVSISPGTYASATITNSGTAANPIVYTGTSNLLTGIGQGSTAQAVLTFSGASNIEVENLRMFTGAGTAVVVDGGSNDTFVRDEFESQSTTNGTTGLHITGGASAVTVRDSYVYDGVVVDDGSTGTVITTNEFNAQLAEPISIQGAANTAITSNTIGYCGPAVSVTASSSSTSIENNVVTDAEDNSQNSECPAASQQVGFLVDASSAAGTTLDYNDVYTTGTDYEWNGTAYPSAAALYGATGQGQHDNNSGTGAELAEGSPLINSANSAAIGEQPIDFNGDARVVDPLVTPTGAGPYDYYDRGASQFQDPHTATPSSTYTVSATKMPAGGTITVHAAFADTWGDTFDSYEFYDSADPTPVVSSTDAGTLTIPSTGNDTVYAAAQPTGSSSYYFLGGSNYQQVSVVAPEPLTAADVFYPVGPLSLQAFDSGTTDAWNITGVSFNWGDGTAATSTTDGDAVTHAYAKGGTYTITETVTDADGNTATTSSQFTTSAPGPNTLVHSLVANGSMADFASPAGSTGIAQAAITGMPNGSSQIAAVTTSGHLEFNVRNASGSWQGWTALSQPGVTVKSVSIAGMPNGTSQLIEVTSAGTLLHTIRNANGTWQSSGWGSPAGSTGITEAAITAMPNGSSQLVSVTTAGVLQHNIRNASGSWQGWDALSQPGTTVTDAGIAGMPNGSSQIAEVTSAGVMKHDVRLASGAWQATGWGSPAGSTGISQVAIAALPNGSSQFVAVESNGTFEMNTRSSGGSWNGWNQNAPMTAVGTVLGGSIAGLPNGNSQIIAVTG
jgi:Right handed beta helix region/PKD domain